MRLRTQPPSETSEWGNAYVTGEKHRLFWSTNGWAWPAKEDHSNFIEMNVGDDYYSMQFQQNTATDKLNFVRAYPTGGLGSFGARYEHNGMKSGKVPVLPGRRGFDGMATDVFDMEYVAKLAGGIPCFLRDLPQINGWFDWRFEGDGKINTFLDLYLNDVSNRAWSGDYVDTINGIGYNRTKAWNINVWAMLTTNEDHSDRERSRARWSGGTLIKRVRVPSTGEEFNVYYKRETAGSNNNFNLLSFHSLDRENVNTIDVTSLLLEVVLVNDWIKDIRAAGLNPRDDMRNPDDRMVLCGLHGLGNEVWTRSGKITYSRYAWMVDGEKFGFGHPEAATAASVRRTAPVDYVEKPAGQVVSSPEPESSVDHQTPEESVKVEDVKPRKKKKSKSLPLILVGLAVLAVIIHLAS